MYIIGDRQTMAVSTTTEGGDAWRRNSMDVEVESKNTIFRIRRNNVSSHGRRI